MISNDTRQDSVREDSGGGSGTSVVLDVQGMTCGSCEAHVRKALAQVAGVADVVVSRRTSSATVRWTSQAPAAEALIDAVRAAGYDARVAHPDQDSAQFDSPPKAASRCGCC